MSKLSPKAIVLVLTTFLSACSINEVGPSNKAEVQSNVILNSTFESNGNPSLQGWKAQDSLSRVNLSFSGDVPAGGGLWSLGIHGVLFGEAGVDTTIGLSCADSIKTYVLTFWGKGRGSVVFSIDSPTRGVVIVPAVNCTSWTAFSDTLVRVDSTENSLRVTLTSWDQDSSSSVLFNDVKVVAIKP